MCSGCATFLTEATTQLDINPLALQRGLSAPIPEDMRSAAQQTDWQKLSSGQVIQDQASEQRVKRIVERLVRFCHKPGFQPVTRIVNDESLNAEATPGFIYVHTGLLRAVESDDELAGILGHELAHIDAGHQKRSQVSGIWTNLILAGAAALTKGETADEIIQRARALIPPAYSREHEREADILGTIYAYRAGYNPARLTEFFNKAWRQEEDQRIQAETALRWGYAQAANVCQTYQAYNQTYQRYPTPQTYLNLVNTYNACLQAQQQFEAARANYNSVVQQLSPLFRDHPVDSERIALISSLTEYLKGQRTLDSIPDATAQKVISTLALVEAGASVTPQSSQDAAHPPPSVPPRNQQDGPVMPSPQPTDKKRASLTSLIQSWYKQLTPQEQAATPYEQYESTLLAATDLPARQGVIRGWYDFMEDTYKQKVPLARFEAIAIREPLASLRAALAKQRGGDIVFCPVGGERYRSDVRFCPKHGVETRVLGQATDS